MTNAKITTETGGEFIGYEDLKSISYSMQLDSGTTVCEYTPSDKLCKVTIEVRGEVHSDNNWFEIFLWDRSGAYLNSDVVDVEGEDFEALVHSCEDYLNSNLELINGRQS